MKSKIKLRNRFGKNLFFKKIKKQIQKKYFTYTALNRLDKKIEKYLPSTGFFVEAGANDGITQSNTFFLEKKYGWTGLLIEPVPELYSECKINRPKATVVNCALVSIENSKNEVELINLNLMSRINYKTDSEAEEALNKIAEEVQGISRSYVKVKAQTLTKVLLDNIAPKNFDLLSLDVEGYEVEVLKGLDISKFSPKFILIETQIIDQVLKTLSYSYKIKEKLSHHDFLLEFAKNP